MRHSMVMENPRNHHFPRCVLESAYRAESNPGFARTAKSGCATERSTRPPVEIPAKTGQRRCSNGWLQSGGRPKQDGAAHGVQRAEKIRTGCGAVERSR